MTEKTQVKSQSFSQPWKFSDVVLVVEEERLHVHRAVLAMSSPMFEKMFTSESPDKYEREIPLPGKSSAEVKELLLMIYPSVSEKQITEENSHFLLKLAHEYQMDAIVRRCEDFLVDKLKTKPKDTIVTELIFGQTYKLEKLRRASVDLACNLTLEELKQDEMYDQIQSENLKEIVEGVIRRLERELEESLLKNKENDRKIANVKRHIDSSLQGIANIASRLVDHAVTRDRGYYHKLNRCRNTDSYIVALQMDRGRGEYYCTACNGIPRLCSGLSPAAEHLQSLVRIFESLEALITR